MFTQGGSVSFDDSRFFTGQNWYHIATNTRPKASAINMIFGIAETCDNVITDYKKTDEGTILYLNACYTKGRYDKSREVTGSLTPTGQPGVYEMIDSGTRKGQKPTKYVIYATDYDNFAVISDGDKSFWVLSRKPEICSNSFQQILSLLEGNFDTRGVSVDLNVIKQCTS